ncbi:MAG: hypothetical protein AB2533_15640 [Candidatus Thiodiazotropha endolucinida]
MHRENVIFVLQKIALRSEQIDLYKERDELIDLPGYLLNKWEDSYRPEKQRFTNEFTEDELKQMNCFTDFFLNRVGNLPNEFSELLKDPYWSTVCEYAGELLQDFERNENI